MKIYTVIGTYTHDYKGKGEIIRSFILEVEAESFRDKCEEYDVLPVTNNYGLHSSEMEAWENNHPAGIEYFNGYAVIEHDLMGGDI